MGNVKIRHLVPKGALFYWQPSKALRAAGFKSQRLPSDFAAAVARAQELNAEVDRWRAGQTPTAINPDTLPWLIRLYKESDLWRDLQPKTQRGYSQVFKALEAWSEGFKHPAIGDIAKRDVKELHRSLKDTPAWANAVIRVLRLLLNFAVDEGLLAINPASRPRLKTLAPRRQIWTVDQLQAFAMAARAEGLPSMALAVLLGASLAQREGDILALAWPHFDGARFTIRQRKTGALVEVPAVADLVEALAQTPRAAATIVISEATGLPYREDHFRHEFARLRGLAGLPADLQFRDLRRTAVVRLAEAGCTVPEISAISGHTIERTAQILEVYLPRTGTMAANAIAKLEGHRNRISTKVGSSNEEEGNKLETALRPRR